MPFCGVSRFVVTGFSTGSWSLTKGNSPFGAWVVCVYRIEAVDSPALVNATICAFFVSIQNLAKFIVEQEQTPEFKNEGD